MARFGMARTRQLRDVVLVHAHAAAKQRYRSRSGVALKPVPASGSSPQRRMPWRRASRCQVACWSWKYQGPRAGGIRPATRLLAVFGLTLVEQLIRRAQPQALGNQAAVRRARVHFRFLDPLLIVMLDTQMNHAGTHSAIAPTYRYRDRRTLNKTQTGDLLRDCHSSRFTR